MFSPFHLCKAIKSSLSLELMVYHCCNFGLNVPSLVFYLEGQHLSVWVSKVLAVIPQLVVRPLVQIKFFRPSSSWGCLLVKVHFTNSYLGSFYLLKLKLFIIVKEGVMLALLDFCSL